MNSTTNVDAKKLQTRDKVLIGASIFVTLILVPLIAFLITYIQFRNKLTKQTTGTVAFNTGISYTVKYKATDVNGTEKDYERVFILYTHNKGDNINLIYSNTAPDQAELYPVTWRNIYYYAIIALCIIIIIAMWGSVAYKIYKIYS